MNVFISIMNNNYLGDYSTKERKTDTSPQTNLQNSHSDHQRLYENEQSYYKIPLYSINDDNNNEDASPIEFTDDNEDVDTQNEKNLNNWYYKLRNFRNPTSNSITPKEEENVYIYKPFQYKNQVPENDKQRHVDYKDDLDNFDAIFNSTTTDKNHDFKIYQEKYEEAAKPKRLSASYFKSSVFDDTAGSQPFYVARTQLSPKEQEQQKHKVRIYMYIF